MHELRDDRAEHLPDGGGPRPRPRLQPGPFLKNAMVRGRAWYTLLDGPVLILDVTV